ncbi:MAG TPA: ABC transporter substrate-binding protein [Flavobacterium sp.]|nr:ABC transporter substrate-binding protein [Flavobacterium sp.]
MRRYIYIFAATLSLLACNKKETNQSSTDAIENEAEQNQKIVSLNGAISEALVILGAESQIIGVDVTSTYPESLKTKATDLGHVRSITAESILSLKPNVVFATSKDVNPTLNEQLKAANVSLKIINQEYSTEGTKNLITEIAKFLKKENYQPLLENIDRQIAEIKPFEKKPKVLFIYARGAGNLMVAGKETPLHHMIELAGVDNAAATITDFKPLTPEALLTINPDVILLFDTGLQSLGGIDGLLKVEGISATNAGKNQKIITMDGQLLSGFGPRLGEAVVELHNKLK